MKQYRIDVRVYATAYINADSEEEALAMAKDLKDSEIIVRGGGDVLVDGGAYDDPHLPGVALSPVMTIWGVEEESEMEIA